MENAKRMVLIDEKMLDYKPMLQHFQTKQDLRPTEQSVKSTISQQLKSTLDDPAVPDDVKAKRYRQNLTRFLHTKRELVETTPSVDELLDIKEPPQKKKKKTPKKRRASERPKKKPQRFADIDWQSW